MFARISRSLHSHDAGKALFLKLHLLRSKTTVAAKSDQNNGVLAEYLMKSLGFSKEEAISTVGRVAPRLKPINKDPDVVVNFFQNSGLDKAQIKSVIGTCPGLLLCNVEKTLKPKFEVIQELGVSGPDIGTFLMRNKSLLETGVDSHLKPRIQSLKNLLDNDEERVARVLRKCPSLLAYNALKSLEQNLLLLRNIGFSDKMILKFVTRNPGLFLIVKEGWLENIGHRVENDFGISPKSSLFYQGVEVLCTYKQTTLDAKWDFLRSFGWSDENIRTMVKNYPLILGASVHRLRRTLDFFMNEVGYSAEYLASHPRFFSVSLEKRVIPRHEVLKTLKDKNLMKKRASLYTVIGMPESQFLGHFLLSFKEVAPDVYRSYAEHVRS